MDNQEREAILRHFREIFLSLETARNTLRSTVAERLGSAGIKINAVTGRVKSEESLLRKLVRKSKYTSITDVTDLIGIRIIAYDTHDSELVSRVIRSSFVCDWENCEDKVDRLKVEQFGYRSDHYVVYIADLVKPKLENLRAEIQVRTVLQHAWAEIEHDDLGYHSDDLVPSDIRRRLARTAAILEGVDAEFREIRRLARKASLRPLRAEGLAESLGEIEFSINVMDLRRADRESDLTLFFNTVITPTPGEEKEPLLIIEDAAISKPVRGDLVGANAVRFRDAFPKYITDNLRHIRCRLRGIRVNANMLAVGAGTHEQMKVIACVIPNTDEVPQNPTILYQQAVAAVGPGLISRCLLNLNQGANDFELIECEFSEGFPGAFKNATEETAGDRLAKHGTRLRAEFAGVPEWMEIWVSVRNVAIPAQSNAQIVASLVEADPSGDGPGLKIRPSRRISTGAGDFEEVALAQKNSQSRYAVWEIDSEVAPSPCLRRLTFRVYIARNGGPRTNIICRLSFAPLSFIATNHPTAPIPRFVDFSTRQTITLNNTANAQ